MENSTQPELSFTNVPTTPTNNAGMGSDTKCPAASVSCKDAEPPVAQLSKTTQADSVLPQDDLDFVCAQAKEASEKAIRLKEEAAVASELDKFWSEYQRLFKANCFLALCAHIEKSKPLLRKLNTSAPAVFARIDQQEKHSETKGRETLRQFPRHIEKALMEHGMSIDPDSRHPKYTFHEHFLVLEIDDGKKMAQISTKLGKLDKGRFPADIGPIIDFLRQEEKRLFKRKFDPKKFLQKLLKEYRGILKKGKKTDGDGVPIREVLDRIKGQKTDESTADLMKLLQSGVSDVEDRRLILQQTKDVENGIHLKGGYVGFISFGKNNNQPTTQQ